MEQMFFVSKDLSKLIESSNLLTWGEVVGGLKTYIAKKKLFNFEQQKVSCENDELSKLFGKEEFSIREIKNLLQKFIFPIDKAKETEGTITMYTAEITHTPTTSHSSASKRRNEESITEDFKSKSQKKFDSSDSLPFSNCTSMILHLPISASSLNEDSKSTESVKYFEAKDSCNDKDTSDEDTIVSEEIIEISEFDIEFEPVFSEDSTAGELSESDSDLDNMDLVFTSINLISNYSFNTSDTDVEYLADLSSDESTFSDSFFSFDDDEISEMDCWICVKCNSNNNPTKGYCCKCFEFRSGWFASKSKDQSHTPKSFSKARRKPRSKREKRKDNKKKEPVFQHDVPCSSSVCSNVPQDKTNADSKLCLICCENERNSSIIHGKSAHNIVCYACGKKLRRHNMPCPICRRYIERVVIQV